MAASLSSFVAVSLCLYAFILLVRACDNHQRGCEIYQLLSQKQHQQNNLVDRSKITNQQVHDEPETVSNQANDLKRILYWTGYNNRKDMNFGYGQEPFIRAGCEVTSCFATDDRSELNRSDALIFHAGDFKADDLPDHRLPHQRYIFFNSQTLVNKRNSMSVFSSKMDHYFNWTMTHRRGSDIYIAAPYGTLLKHKEQSFKNLNQYSSYSQIQDSLASVLKSKIKKRFTEKGKMVAWFCSNKTTPGRREDYVQELGKHVQIDVYGKCGNMSYSSSEFDTLLDSYKFYLSAENSLCPDYVTKEFYRALEADVVPIVYGGADYAHYAPLHSYINVADFGSPKDLAEYLHFLADNEALYSKYFDWKQEWEVVKRPLNAWCNLCAKLNDPKSFTETKSYENISKWWYDDIPCFPGTSFLDSVSKTKQ